MISDNDRSGYFGASDVSYIMSRNTGTKSFGNWWLTKIGIVSNNFENISMNAGTNKEHQILESLEVFGMVYDRQVIIEDIKLRVNLDGDDGRKIYECKTFKAERGFKCPKKYIEQVNVQMFATGIREADIIAYGLTEDDFDNYFLPIDKERLITIPVEYDETFIKAFYERITYFAKCLKEGEYPCGQR